MTSTKTTWKTKNNNKNWNKIETAKYMHLRYIGATEVEIAKKLGRTPSSIAWLKSDLRSRGVPVLSIKEIKLIGGEKRTILKASKMLKDSYIEVKGKNVALRNTIESLRLCNAKLTNENRRLRRSTPFVRLKKMFTFSGA